MTAGEAVIGQVDMKRLNKVHRFPRQKPKNIDCQSAADVSFRHHWDITALRRWDKPRAKADFGQKHWIHIVEDHKFRPNAASDVFQGNRRSDRRGKFFPVHVRQDLIPFLQHPAGSGNCGILNPTDFLGQSGNRKKTELRSRLLKERVWIDIGGPHHLVITGHQPKVGVPKSGPHSSRTAESFCPSCQFRQGADNRFHHRALETLDRTRGLQCSNEAAGR